MADAPRAPGPAAPLSQILHPASREQTPALEPQQQSQASEAQQQVPAAEPQQQSPGPAPIEAVPHEDDRSETESWTGESSQSSLSSLAASIREHRRENGRTYHTLSDGTYILPNDEMEQDRLDLTHHLWGLTFDDKLCMCPKNAGAKNVLDIGTGTGIWAMDYADEHPEARVIGVDLSPIQPDFVPPNCSFEIDDIEKDWTWSTKFDFILIRHMNSAIASWERLLKQAYDNLEPGGYVEMTDNSFPLQCNDGTMDPRGPVAQWSTLLMDACDKMGRPVTVPSTFKRLLENAGFEDVVEVKRVWPLNEWPKDPKLKEIGRWSQACSLQGCEASALALFTRVLGWTREETLVFCSGVRRDLHNKNIHAHWDIYCAYGRKPLREPTPAQTQEE